MTGSIVGRNLVHNHLLVDVDLDIGVRHEAALIAVLGGQALGAVLARLIDTAVFVIHIHHVVERTGAGRDNLFYLQVYGVKEGHGG